MITDESMNRQNSFFDVKAFVLICVNPCISVAQKMSSVFIPVLHQVESQTDYRSISGITRSRLPRSASASGNRVPREHSRNRLRFEKLGERNLRR
jgi:hypothetical protein